MKEDKGQRRWRGQRTEAASKGLPSSRSWLVRPRRGRPAAIGERGWPRLRTRLNIASAKLPHGDAVLGCDLHQLAKVKISYL